MKVSVALVALMAMAVVVAGRQLTSDGKEPTSPWVSAQVFA